MIALTASVHGLDRELSLMEAYLEEYLQDSMEHGRVRDILHSISQAKGKRIRPILVLLSGRMGDGHRQQSERLCKLAALIEMVHMASLVHDDIVDDSPLRRGRPTIQRRFGKDMAVYAGDLLLSRVMFQLFRENMSEAGLVLGKTVERMCRGEIGQSDRRYDTETTMDAYLGNISGKTVALFRASCKLGGLEGRCGDDEILRLAKLGEHLGYLFQLRDDLLDFLSDEDQEGKPVHKDFLDGIYTMPVLYALGSESCGPRLREIARETAAGNDSSGLLAEVCSLVHHSGGIAFTRRQIFNHAVQAERLLLALPQNEASGAIWQLINWLKNTDRAMLKSASAS